MIQKIILDLCGGTGAWSKPYKDAGYDVRNMTLPIDVRLLKYVGKVHGILAAPPCTMFASSGARWIRTEADMLRALTSAISPVPSRMPSSGCVRIGSIAQKLSVIRMVYATR